MALFHLIQHATQPMLNVLKFATYGLDIWTIQLTSPKRQCPHQQYKEDTVNSDAVVVNMSMAVNTATSRERWNPDVKPGYHHGEIQNIYSKTGLAAHISFVRCCANGWLL